MKAGVETWAAAGFGAELVPLCGPDHGCTAPGKVPHAPGWQKLEITPALLARWARTHRGNLGLRTGPFPAVDLDVEEPGLADECERVALVTVGSTARRTRENSARRLLLYRLDGEPFGKARLRFTGPGGAAGAVEILGAGQQCVVAGIHHTGAAIMWRAGQPAAAGLATMTRAGRDAFMAALRRRLSEIGCRIEGDDAGAPRGQVVQLRPRPAREPMDDADVAAWALDRLSPDCPYDVWIRVGQAIHARWPIEGGLDLWDAWSRGARDRYPGRKVLERHWRSFGTGRGVGFGTLVWLGRGGQ